VKAKCTHNRKKLEKELIINATPTEVEIALLEGKKLVEIHHQKTNNNFTVGDIFLGKIRKLMLLS
jgi:ribonuclease G